MFDVIVIGGGPSGMTTALYALRNGQKVLVLEAENFGGQIANSPRVENFPSIKEISGAALSDNLFEQIMALGAEFELEKVIEVTKMANYFMVKTAYSSYEAKTIVIATGAKHRHIGVEGEEKYLGHGVSYCAVCDGAFYKNEEIALIGDANTALQYALMLAEYCPKVHLCTLFDHFFGDQLLVDRVLKKPNIIIKHNLALQAFKGTDELSGLLFENTIDHSPFAIDVKAVFIAIGQVPDNQAFKNLVELDKAGYIISNELGETKTPGIFVAGDCRQKTVRQLTTAVADGAIAAISANNYLNRH